MGNNPTKAKGKIPTVEVTPSPRTVHEYILGRIRNHGSKVAQVDSKTGEQVTFDAILERSAALAAGLSARGLRAGEVALIIGENSVHYPWVLLGVLQTGAAAHLINPRSTPREVEHAMSISRPSVALLSAHVAKETGVTSVLRDASCVRHILEWGGDEVHTNPPDGISSLELLLVSPAKSTVSIPSSPAGDAGCATEAATLSSPEPAAKCLVTPNAPPPTPTSVAVNYGDSYSGDVSPLQKLHAESGQQTEGSSVVLILSSSGSTGLPKGVMLTNDNLLAALDLGPVFVKSDDVMLGVSPYYHAYGGVLMLAACCAGARVVALGRFSMNAMLRAVQEHEVTVMHVVSSLLVSLSKIQDEARLQPLRCLRRIWSGAAQISPLVQSALKNRLPDVRLAHSYGMTETTFTTFHGEVRADKPGSPGTLVPGMDCKVIDPETGNPLPVGARGELCFKGQMVMRGYLGNAEATNEALDSEGWLHSGDLGFADEDGYYYIIERLKDVLKYNGHQVSPSELEALLTTHPAVNEAAVIGEPHEYGDAPRALVILADGAQVTAEELQTYIAGKVAPHKQLRGGISFVKAFPRTGSGKLQRKKLRSLLLGEDHNISSTSSSTLGGDSAPNSPDLSSAAEYQSPDSVTSTGGQEQRGFVSSFEEAAETPEQPYHRPSVCSLSTIYSNSTVDSPTMSSPSESATFPPDSPATPATPPQVRRLREAATVPLPLSNPNSPAESNVSQGSASMELTPPVAGDDQPRSHQWVQIATIAVADITKGESPHTNVNSQDGKE